MLFRETVDSERSERSDTEDGAQRVDQPEAEQSAEDDTVGAGRVGNEEREVSEND